MKKIHLIYIVLIAALFPTMVNAQDFKTEAYIGYARTMYDLPQNDGQTGFVPAGVAFLVEVADGVEVGVDARANAYSPTFKMKHPYTDHNAFTQKYRGVNTAVIGRYYAPIDFPVYGQLGFGMFVGGRQKTIYTKDYVKAEPWLEDEITKFRRQTVKYKPSFLFEIQAGCLLADNLNLFIRYSNHKNKLKDDVNDEGYRAADFMFGVGVRF